MACTANITVKKRERKSAKISEVGITLKNQNKQLEKLSAFVNVGENFRKQLAVKSVNHVKGRHRGTREEQKLQMNSHGRCRTLASKIL